MEAPATRPLTRRAKLAWMAATVAACLAAGAWQRPLSADNQVYFYIAERAASGVAPHVSVVDSKSELSGLLSAAGIAVGRRIGLDDVRSGRVVSIAFAAAAVALIAELGLVVSGAAAGAHLAALALLTTRGFVDHAAIGTNPKIFLIAFVVLAHLLCARRRWLAAGVAACGAFLCWQPALAVVVAVAAEALLGAGAGARTGLRALSVWGGALCAFAAYQLYYAAHGAEAEQLSQCYVMTLGSVHAPASFASALWFVISDAGRRHGSLWLAPTAWFASLAVGVGCALVKPAATLGCLRQRPGAVSLVLGSVVATAFTLYDHQGLPDLLLPAPYFALATAWLGTWVARRCAWLSGRDGAGAFAVSLIAAVLVAQAARAGIGAGRGPRTLADQYEVGAATRSYVERYDGVWCYRCPYLLGLAHADNWVPYAMLYDDIETRFPIRRFRPLRDGRMPEVILRKKGPLPGGRAYLRTEYREVTSPLFAREGVRVYVRRADSPTPVTGADKPIE